MEKEKHHQIASIHSNYNPEEFSKENLKFEKKKQITNKKTNKQHILLIARVIFVKMS